MPDEFIHQQTPNKVSQPAELPPPAASKTVRSVLRGLLPSNGEWLLDDMSNSWLYDEFERRKARGIADERRVFGSSVMGCCICQSDYTIDVKNLLFGPSLLSKTNCEQCGHYFTESLPGTASLLVSLLFAHHNQFHLFTPHQAAYFAALATITFLIPLYCMQNSVLFNWCKLFFDSDSIVSSYDGYVIVVLRKRAC